jgi:hypothetical protein
MCLVGDQALCAHHVLRVVVIQDAGRIVKSRTRCIGIGGLGIAETETSIGPICKHICENPRFCDCENVSNVSCPGGG